VLSERATKRWRQSNSVQRGAQGMEISADLGTREGIEKLWKEVISTARDLELRLHPRRCRCRRAVRGDGARKRACDGESELCRFRAPCEICCAAHDREEFRPNFCSRLRSRGRWYLRARRCMRQAKAFDLSLAHSIRYELRDTTVAVIALQPGPTASKRCSTARTTFMRLL
jgi:uncharacterized protein